MEKSSLKSSTIIGGVLLLMCFAAAYFLTKPQWDNYSVLHAQVVQAKSEQAKLQQDLSALQNFLNDYQSHSKDVSTANLALPVKDADTADFVGALGDLAKAAGVALEDFQMTEKSVIGKPSPDNTIQALEINLTAAGSYPSFKDFMMRLENHLRLVDIEHISVKADDAGQIEYQVTMRTYYQK